MFAGRLDKVMAGYCHTSLEIKYTHSDTILVLRKGIFLLLKSTGIEHTVWCCERFKGTCIN